MFDITLLTEIRYLAKPTNHWYLKNILEEDAILTAALERRGLKVFRTNWDNNSFDWNNSSYAIFRTTWDYFNRIKEFTFWLNETQKKTKFINDIKLINWNIDKHYLRDLSDKGINIPPTVFIERGDKLNLGEHLEKSNFNQAIIKPVIGGAARHIYKIDSHNVEDYKAIFASLIQHEAMLLQEFQTSIYEKGEVSMVMFESNFSHAVLKNAKSGDFRVQDDFGGILQDYIPSKEELKFAQEILRKINPTPIYTRIDILWDNNNNLALGEVELIEPELWFRRNTNAAELMAEAILKRYF